MWRPRPRSSETSSWAAGRPCGTAPWSAVSAAQRAQHAQRAQRACQGAARCEFVQPAVDSSSCSCGLPAARRCRAARHLHASAVPAPCTLRRRRQQREHRGEDERAGECGDPRGQAQRGGQGGRGRRTAVQACRLLCKAEGCLSRAADHGACSPEARAATSLAAAASLLWAPLPCLTRATICPLPAPPCALAGHAHHHRQQRDDRAGGHHPRGHHRRLRGGGHGGDDHGRRQGAALLLGIICRPSLFCAWLVCARPVLQGMCSIDASRHAGVWDTPFCAP